MAYDHPGHDDPERIVLYWLDNHGERNPTLVAGAIVHDLQFAHSFWCDWCEAVHHWRKPGVNPCPAFKKESL